MAYFVVFVSFVVYSGVAIPSQWISSSMTFRENAFRLVRWAMLILLGGWLLTLGVFVESSLNYQYQDRKLIADGIDVSVALTRAGVREFGIPYLFHKRTDVGPFGVSLRILSPHSIDEVHVTRVLIDGQQVDLNSIEASSYEKRNFFFTIPGVVRSNDQVEVGLVGAIVVDGRRLDFETSHLVRVSFETRFGPGWLMLLYYSQF